MRGTARSEFDAFAVASAPALRRFAIHLVGDASNADDVVQETLLRLSLRWPRVDSPMAYARLTLLNVVRDAARARSRRPEVMGLSPVDRDSGIDVAGDVAARDEVLAALAALPLRMRAVVVLRHVEDLSEAETAAALGTSVGSVKSQSSRGLARLRSLLRQDDSEAGARRER